VAVRNRTKLLGVGVEWFAKITGEKRSMTYRIALAFLLLSMITTATAADRKHIVDDSLKSYPFSNGVLVGDTLYIGGHIGIDPKTGKAASDPKVEATLVMDAIKKTVESAGMTMDDVVSVQVHCSDLNLFDTFNKVYRTYFTNGFPARAFLGTNKLLLDAHFEVLGIAVKRSK
jgi:2-iminobutanoate/2-iminopropanoate deaminase